MDGGQQSGMGPHQGGVVRMAGVPLERAQQAMIMVHGRGDSAAGILGLVYELGRGDFAYVAPEATGNTWYPYSFLEPMERNEPWLSSALQRIGEVVAQLEAGGIPAERTMLLGFSQGACLVTEYAARNARRYGGLVGLSGGLIGPEGTPRKYPGSLAGTPVFLGCSDVDFHIPAKRVTESAEVLRELGGAVTARLYPGMGHTVNQDEIVAIQTMMAELMETKG